MKAIVITIILLLVGITILAIPACPSGQDTAKLDSRLNQLIMAEERGEAEAFAQLRNIDLIDGSIRVIIECEPGQAEAAAKAAAKVGAEKVNIYRDMVGAVVPINKLTTLAKDKSIHFIRLPAYSVPATSS
jgi:hypothetical protein